MCTIDVAGATVFSMIRCDQWPLYGQLGRLFLQAYQCRVIDGTGPMLGCDVCEVSREMNSLRKLRARAFEGFAMI